MKEELKIHEAQIESSEASIEMDEKKKKADFYIELALFLILGILMGIALKTEAVKKITVGFDDYKMKFFSQNYDLNKLQDEQIQKMNEEQAQMENSASNGMDETGEDQIQNTN